MSLRIPLLRQCGLAFALCIAAVTTCMAASEAQEIAKIKQTLAASYPDVHVTDVRPSPIPGLYAVLSLDAVAYVDRSGEYLIGGPMIATRNKADLSQQALDERDHIQFEQLPLDKSIKTVRGTGERILAVFADPDCPYCHTLEKELAGINDVTIYTFLYPLVSVHPDARNKSHALWCAPDRSTAWHDWMILDQAPQPPVADCNSDPLDDVANLGTRFGIASTPVIFLENGLRVRGSHTAAQLNTMLGTAHADKLHANNTHPNSPRS